jgi:hypothetical protein
MQVSQTTNGTAFEGKGDFKPHRFPPTPSTSTPYAKKPFAAYAKQPYSKHPIPIAKPSAQSFNKPPAQFPPTPSTIIKPPRFYSNQSLIVPRSKPNLSGTDNRAHEEEDCICERDDAIIICQK